MRTERAVYQQARFFAQMRRRKNRAWFGVAQNDRARRVTLTRALEGRQEVEG